MPKKRLYEVHLTGLAYVMAESESDAEETIEDHLGIFLIDEGIINDVTGGQATTVDSQWQNAFPYRSGDDDNEDHERTCQEILDAQVAQDEADAAQLSLAIGGTE